MKSLRRPSARSLTSRTAGRSCAVAPSNRAPDLLQVQRMPAWFLAVAGEAHAASVAHAVSTADTILRTMYLSTPYCVAHGVRPSL